MKGLWNFFSVKSNREIISWFFGGVTVLVTAAWAVFVYFDKSSDNESAEKYSQCFPNEVHPRAATVVNDLLDRLTGNDLVYGWKGGNLDLQEFEDKKHGVQILDIVRDGDAVVIRYDWQAGVLKLKPRLAAYSGSIAGSGPAWLFRGKVLASSYWQGSWEQTNGAGCLDLHFSNPNNARMNGNLAIGKWTGSEGSSDVVGSNFIRLLEGT